LQLGGGVGVGVVEAPALRLTTCGLLGAVLVRVSVAVSDPELVG
jgi:hypothetical protein